LTTSRAGSQESAVKVLTGCISIVVVLVAWQVSASSGLVDASYTSSPLEIVKAAAELVTSGELAQNLPTTLFEFSIGYALAVVIGVPLGMLMGWRLRVRQVFEPLLYALYVTPSLALFPIFVLVWGIGTTSKIAIVFVDVLATVVINAMAGVQETDARTLRMAHAFGAGQMAQFWKIIAPSAMPTTVAGLRLGVGRGVITVIVAELYGGVVGLGVMISAYGSSFNVPPLIVLALLAGLFGLIVGSLLRRIERSVFRWE